ncbi:MAG: hypothetical protein GF310_14860 [candidate division Zixibacteria bacterium]|nr:hypothetical protein [candidate division Zixibacteria bacterium]
MKKARDQELIDKAASYASTNSGSKQIMKNLEKTYKMTLDMRKSGIVDSRKHDFKVDI